MYYEYWDLKKPPFDNVPDPSMYVDAHESVENTVAESLFAIEEGNECIAVIVGDVGLGKTLSLRLILDALPEDKYRVAFITNPDMSFIQLLREIVGQLTGDQCEIKGKIALLETFNRLLFETADEGKKVLIFIDEANALTPANLESLRLLTNMQDDNRNLFTLLLAGQIELARRLEHPRRANLFQRVGAYCRVEKIKSEAMVKIYVETRLRLAGGERPVFTEDAFPALWECSEYGVPRLINKICKLSLKAGETNGFRTVDGEVVRLIGERFQKLTGQATAKRKPRREQPDTPPAIQFSESRRIESGIDHPGPGDTVTATPDNGMDGAGDAEGQGMDEIHVNGTRILVRIPPAVMEEAAASSPEQWDRLAGVLAARTLEENPALVSPVSKDPVAVWEAIHDLILSRLEDRKKAC
jgi:type II secretory pathway predicted ATPase ExeA